MQIYYILEEIKKKYPKGLMNYMEKKITNDDEDYFLRPNNARELLQPEHLMPFLMLYVKEMKSEAIEILLHPKCQQFLDGRQCPYDDLSKLSDDDVGKFKDLFIMNRVSKAHRDADKTMETLLDYCVDILSKKVPVENVNVKLDQIAGKIRLIPLPEGIIMEDYTEKIAVEVEGEEQTQTKKYAKNTGEKGLILIRPPTLEGTSAISIEIAGAKDAAADDQPPAKKIMEEDQKDKAFAVSGRDVPNMPRENFWVVNKHAGRAFRQEFLDLIDRQYPEFFDGVP